MTNLTPDSLLGIEGGQGGRQKPIRSITSLSMICTKAWLPSLTTIRVMEHMPGFPPKGGGKRERESSNSLFQLHGAFTAAVLLSVQTKFQPS